MGRHTHKHGTRGTRPIYRGGSGRRFRRSVQDPTRTQRHSSRKPRTPEQRPDIGNNEHPRVRRVGRLMVFGTGYNNKYISSTRYAAGTPLSRAFHLTHRINGERRPSAAAVLDFINEAKSQEGLFGVLSFGVRRDALSVAEVDISNDNEKYGLTAEAPDRVASVLSREPTVLSDRFGLREFPLPGIDLGIVRLGTYDTEADAMSASNTVAMMGRLTLCEPSLDIVLSSDGRST